MPWQNRGSFYFFLILSIPLVLGKRHAWIRDGEQGHRQTRTVCPKLFDIDYEHPDHVRPFWLAQPRLIDRLTSNKPASKYDIALVTTLSLERLNALEVQCRHWPGTLTGALYIPLQRDQKTVQFTVFDQDLPHYTKALLDGHDTLPDVVKHVKKWAKALQAAPNTCRMELAVYVETVLELNEYWAYPINAMRNRALALAKTESVLIVDGDFVPGPLPWVQNLFAEKGHEGLMSLLNNRTVVVANALDTQPNLTEEKWRNVFYTTLHHGNKSVIRDIALHTWQLIQFQPDGHRETDTMRWYNATEPYEVRYKSPDGIGPSWYEPYFFALKDHLPAYDERYRGYHFNKIAYTWFVYTANFRFLIHPHAFVLHIPHHRGKGPFQFHWHYWMFLKRLFWFISPGTIREGYDGYPRVYVADPDENCGSLSHQKHRI